MSGKEDFEFYASGWDQTRWELNYIGEDKEMDIPEELIAKAEGRVTVAISSSAGNEIESISLPSNIYDVWLGTLYAVKRLKKITVDPKNPYLKDIGGVLFTKDGKKLIKAPADMQGIYTVPEGVEQIGAFAFQNSQLEEVVLPDTVTVIEGGAFQWSNLKRMKVPEGVTRIEDNVFSEAGKLEEFCFLGNTTVSYMYAEMDREMEQRISGEAFSQTSEAYLLACLKCYPALDPLRQKFIAAAKRGGREKILEFLVSTKPDIPRKKGIYEILELDEGEAEIQKYEGKDEILDIPAKIQGKRIVSIGNRAFEKNEYIQKVIVPAGVKRIGKQAFKECVSLEEAVLAESCTEIGKAAFMDCKALKKINLPEGIRVLSSRVLCNCKSLECLVLPKGMEKIEDEALKYCETLNDLQLPAGITYLGKECFYACGFNHGPKMEDAWGYSIKLFAVPESVKQIDDGGNGIFACYPKAQELFGVFDYKIRLLVKKGSVAHRYASKKKIRFELMD